mmetsp:Transcript_4050/g.6093  ORF Transcript_4050/g.6093 Transcript_4050/m.6093 type:complete len:96 (-) Transcript_4050:238-525(-)
MRDWRKGCQLRRMECKMYLFSGIECECSDILTKDSDELEPEIRYQLDILLTSRSTRRHASLNAFQSVNSTPLINNNDRAYRAYRAYTKHQNNASQ